MTGNYVIEYVFKNINKGDITCSSGKFIRGHLIVWTDIDIMNPAKLHWFEKYCTATSPCNDQII